MIADIDTLRALLVRCEGLSGPDREVDALLWCAIGSAPPETLDSALRGDPLDPSKEILGVTMRGYLDRYPERYVDAAIGWKAPKLTASLDAAVALVERVLPKWGIRIDLLKSYCDLTSPEDVIPFLPDLPTCTIKTTAATPPLALCTALLKALIARLEAQDGEVGRGN